MYSELPSERMLQMSRFRAALPLAIVALAMSIGCRSPYYADQGALAGGLGGAGVGALIGSASGHTGAGAVIGAAAGALTGGAVGGALDDIEARNRAQIAAQMGRQPGPGAVNINDVVAMSRSGVDEQLIVNHVNNNGVARPLVANDIIYLQQNGVSPRVIAAMQQPRVIAVAPPPGAVLVSGPPPVVVEQRYYGPHWGYWGPGYYRPYDPGPHVAWGVSVSH
jgi:outer membrane lipoprotein SlyB